MRAPTWITTCITCIYIGRPLVASLVLYVWPNNSFTSEVLGIIITAWTSSLPAVAITIYCNTRKAPASNSINSAHVPLLMVETNRMYLNLCVKA